MSSTGSTPPPSRPAPRRLDLMDPENDATERALQAWLADPAAVTIPSGEGEHGAPHAPADGYRVTQAALVGLTGPEHAHCPLDTRTLPVWVEVSGDDHILTVQSIPVGVNLNCLLGSMTRDPEVLHLRLLGYEPPARKVPGSRATASPEPDFIVHKGLRTSATPLSPRMTMRPAPVAVFRARRRRWWQRRP